MPGAVPAATVVTNVMHPARVRAPVVFKEIGVAYLWVHGECKAVRETEILA